MKMHIIQNLFQSAERRVVSGTDGRAEGLFSSQPHSQLYQWWQVLWKGFHCFQHNNGILSNIMTQKKVIEILTFSFCPSATLLLCSFRKQEKQFSMISKNPVDIWNHFEGEMATQTLLDKRGHNKCNFWVNITFYFCGRSENNRTFKWNLKWI